MKTLTVDCMGSANFTPQRKGSSKRHTCLGLAPPRRTSNKVAHKLSVCGNLNNLSDMAEKIGCLEILFCPSRRDRDLPTARLKNLGPFFSDGRSTKSLPRSCKLSNLIGSYSLQETKKGQKISHSISTFFFPEEKIRYY